MDGVGLLADGGWCRTKGADVKEERKEEYAAQMGTLYEVSVLRSPKVR